MSGFEIAGVILGAFPILISALEGYREVAKRVGLWYSIRREHQKCKNEVNAQPVAFIGNLRRLLLTLAVDDARISRLLADPGGDEWKDAELARRLQDRLQDSHDVLLGTIEDMRTTMGELKNEIMIDAENLRQKIEQTKSPELAARVKGAFKKLGATKDYQLYRMQFALGESVRKSLFEEMKGYNDRLRNLLETSDAVFQAQSARNSTKATREQSVACGFWKHADRLYSVLSKAWNCSCWQQHHAHLLLQDRHRPSPEPDFQLMLWSDSPHLPPDSTSNSWFCHSTRVEVVEGLEATIPIRMAPSPDLLTTATPLHRTATPLKPSLTSGKTQLRTKFTGPSGVPSVTLTFFGDAPDPKSRIPKTAQREQARQIPSLCATLRRQPPLPASCHGYLLAASERYYIYSANTQIRPENDDTTAITLESLLRDSAHPLTRLQRYSLAVTVASSFIQLAGTPWMRSRWAKSDLVFFRNPTEPSTLGLLERPFVSRDFSQGSDDADAASPKAVPSDEIIGGFESLGIVLLELCFGKPIEVYPVWLKLRSDLLAALEWLKDVTEEAGPDYADAVAWCLIGGRTISTGRILRHQIFKFSFSRPIDED
ncbi:hypothetical protein C8A01DRAFT_49909 [Parachaetomium inaequale]|uniref:DUF7580 domain-containing protein n=1 Tax=Parachaetomium inaequale TaxID=2588326 RepID=A0AAN6P856_9PEZI|nr:hypothetical protein C8A01DRAFT_49909 [Parachaetomium inaequale]